MSIDLRSFVDVALNRISAPKIQCRSLSVLKYCRSVVCGRSTQIGLRTESNHLPARSWPGPVCSALAIKPSQRVIQTGRQVDRLKAQ